MMMVIFTFSERLLNSTGRELRRALFSLKQIFQVCIVSTYMYYSATNPLQYCHTSAVFNIRYEKNDLCTTTAFEPNESKSNLNF